MRFHMICEFDATQGKWYRAAALLCGLGMIMCLGVESAQAATPRRIGIIHSDTVNSLFGRTIVPLRREGTNHSDLIILNGRRANYLYRGGINFDTLPYLRFDSTWYPSEIGDVNGDGFDDIGVDGLFQGKEKLTIYYGGDMLDTVPDLRLGLDTLVATGIPAVNCGDIDGDGRIDLASSTVPAYDRVSIFSLGPVPDTVQKYMLRPIGISPTVYACFGQTDAGGIAAGDFNGDGRRDLAVGLTFRAQAYRNGEVWVYYGGSDFDTVPDLRIVRPGQNQDYYAMFGSQVVCPGDLNGDGYDDLVVAAAPSPDSTVFIYYGGAHGLDSLPGFSFYAHVSEIRAAGDLNGDGYADIIMSYPSPYVGGYVALYYGGPAMTGRPDLIINPSSDSFPSYTAGFGRGATGVGDFDGDSINDFAFALYDSDTRGHVYIYSGTRPTEVEVRPEGGEPRENTLESNTPNPFNATTRIQFSVMRRTKVRIEIIDILGRTMSVLIDRPLDVGRYSVDWNADGKPSGVYFCVLETDGMRLVRKMVLLK
ncbi:hypothetical protein C3F09_06485 [candidate division GN15 bacterium]|uniref:Secretion system C-terminal sorting domain-containing protein n=1 Tax=candidate division GN15 bacterium TaxID=2072418 RepID=A0A855X2S6_9BACT|nr:MAG: hypothetical protein C3F09_06485 [candidate division GN15 bacterium]